MRLCNPKNKQMHGKERTHDKSEDLDEVQASQIGIPQLN